VESSGFLQQIKQQFGLKSDYALAKCLGITQPEANLIRRGRKVPNPELCIKMANLLGRNPVELLLVAQKDKAPVHARRYWTLKKPTGGTAFTIRAANRLNKPCLILNLADHPIPDTVSSWVQETTIRVLNVAGPRESSSPGIYAQAFRFLRGVLS